IGALPSESNGLLAVYRSTDVGRTWEQTWHPQTGKAPRRVISSTVVGADGSLTINAQDDKQYRSSDGGRTFTKVPAKYRGYAQWTRTGYIATGDGNSELMASEDGVHWRKLEVG
ncbi:MAG TPA: hypothetical protein VH969_08905, partial [Actinophytocola sp.]|uniref:hypothetical protein n=1 Tax=Actinophytocola sp. TaxID=1872138 RepID=UPI002F95A926